ncbi:hypothetical protein ACIBKY_38485 [Nonomuraea sp. NPDC050394]|uniref:hypothetical protein n=1 Tax=Nonomuraea sp. NPDC050394 TaxID=3364363 RepID=UPI00378E2DA3
MLDVLEAWDVNTMLTILAPGIEHHYEQRDGVRIAVMSHEDGSWARAEDHDGKVTVHQSGPRRLWDYLDQVRDFWLRHGELPLSRRAGDDHPGRGDHPPAWPMVGDHRPVSPSRCCRPAC